MINWQKSIHLLMVLALLTGLVAAGAGMGSDQPQNVQPALLKLAANEPGRSVSVIVQAAGDTDAVAALVDSLGGVVTRDLHIINALTAELPAGDVPSLARAGAVRWVSLDGPVALTVKGGGKPTPPDDGTTSTGGGLATSYAQVFLDTMRVRPVWDMGLKGEGIGVAVIDSGIAKEKDLNVRVKGGSASRVVRQISFNPNSTTVNDVFGHGTHIAGIAGGNGNESGGEILGVAPMINLFSLKISDEQGMAFESDTVEAMQWVLDNKDTFNIRVVNLSVNAAQPQSYHTSPIDAAAEILWFNGIVVVASAGNYGPGAVDFAPANDPFIITVGATDELQTADPADDVIASYSAHGTTMDGFSKPDIVAPGQDIISLLSDNSSWLFQHPERVEWGGIYFRLSGTSMSAPMVTGAAALLLQDEPNLNPDQVKYRLMASGRTIAGSEGDPNTYPYLDVYAAVTGTTNDTANTGAPASQLLWTGAEPLTWDSVNWNSVNWNSVNWNSVNWNSVNWNSVNWNSVAWDH